MKAFTVLILDFIAYICLNIQNIWLQSVIAPVKGNSAKGRWRSRFPLSNGKIIDQSRSCFLSNRYFRPMCELCWGSIWLSRFLKERNLWYHYWPFLDLFSIILYLIWKWPVVFSRFFFQINIPLFIICLFRPQKINKTIPFGI